MDDLQFIYIERLSANVIALKAAKQALRGRSASGKRDALESIRRISHSLKGSGATYGFPDITDAAKPVEKSDLKSLLKKLDNLVRVIENTIAQEKKQKSKKILIVEDDRSISQLLELKLASPDREIIVADTSAHAHEELQNHRFSLIMLDLILPDTDGRNFLLHLSKLPDYVDVPVLVLSSKGGTVTKTECFALGASGYYEKPFDPDEIAAVVAAKLRFRPVSMKGIEKDTETEITVSTTGDAAERASKLPERLNQDISIAVFEVVNFDSVVDKFGELIAGEMLHRVKSGLHRFLRKTDHVERLQKSGFLAVFPETNLSDTLDLVEKAVKRISERTFKLSDGRKFNLILAAGVAEVISGSKVIDAIEEANQFLEHACKKQDNIVMSSRYLAEKSKGRVVLAEDDDLIASVVKHRLEIDGFKVQHFKDGASALAAAYDGEISVFVLDVKMPVMDGFELLEQLREREEFANTPIVMLTAMGQERDVIRGFDLGADDYITKPFSPEELKARIHRLLMRNE